MSNLSRMLQTTRAILDEQAPKQQPPFFTRTTWLFAELEELATPAEASLFRDIKIARLNSYVAALLPPLDRLDASTALMEPGRLRHERGQLVKWIREQIERETRL